MKRAGRQLSPRSRLGPGGTVGVLVLGLLLFGSIPFEAANAAKSKHVSDGTIQLSLLTAGLAGVALIVAFVYVIPITQTGRPRPARASAAPKPATAFVGLALLASAALLAAPEPVALFAGQFLGGCTVAMTMIALIRAIALIKKKDS
jgi:hypothetical protein